MTTQASPLHGDDIGKATTPAVVEVAKFPKVEIASVPTSHIESQPRHEGYWTPEWALVWATALLFIATYALYRATVKLSREAKASAEEQSQRMVRSISEAARAATAMEGVAAAMTENTRQMPLLLQKQMRAYISVGTGVPTYQDEKFRFAASPVLTNNGLTPARNVRWVAHAGIIDGRDQRNTHFPAIAELSESDMGIAPREVFTANAVVTERLPDAEVPGAMEGSTRRLFCWGKVEYEDVYGDTWETNFCFNYNFFKGEDEKIKFAGWVYSKGNNAT
jgi:hypothetical protein